MSKMTLPQFQAKIRKFTAQMPEAVEDAFQEVLPVLAGKVITTHLSGPKMARGVGDPTKATLARQSGRLAMGIRHRVRWKGKEVAAQIGVDGLGPYPRYHEKGSPGGRIPKRPYLLPTVKREGDKTKRNILKHIIRKWKRGNYA